MYKPLIFFDAVGTLMYPDTSPVEVYYAVGKKFGSRLSKENITEKFKISFTRIFSSDIGIEIVSSEKLERQRWQQVVDSIFGDISTNNTELFLELWQHFSKPIHWKLFDDTRQLLLDISNAGMYVGIASNFDTRLLTICKEILPEIDRSRIFFSTDLGYAKPDINFYKLIEDATRDEKHEYVMIGDHPVNDIEAATKAGWLAFHRDDIDIIYNKLNL